jgi:hypothetical protein
MLVRSQALLTLLLLVSAPGRCADISGRVPGSIGRGMQIEVGYAGLDRSGTCLTDRAGTTAVDGAATVKCTTYRPRTTEVVWDPETGCRYRHVGLPAGTYVLYARITADEAGDRVCVLSTWRTVRVRSARERLALDLPMPPASCGALRVTAPGRVGLHGVSLTPATERGGELFTGSDEAFGLSVEADLGRLGTTLRGLRAGTYRLRLRQLHRQGTLQTGQVTTISEAGHYTVRVVAGKQMLYVLPRPGRPR